MLLFERLALELGADEADLAVFAGNTTALSLYESLDYRVDGAHDAQDAAPGGNRLSGPLRPEGASGPHSTPYPPLVRHDHVGCPRAETTREFHRLAAGGR